jgi:hypothetical protein
MRPNSIDSMNLTLLPRRPQPRCGFASAFALSLALVVGGASTPGRVDGTVSAQELNPCALLTNDEIQPLAPNTSVPDGVSNSLPAFGHLACHYTWGTGTGRVKLDVVVTEASRMFSGVSPDQARQRLLDSVRAGTGDVVISEVGDAAVFKPDSVAYATATALVKSRILQVHLDGVDARDRKDQIIELLKSAASRL